MCNVKAVMCYQYIDSWEKFTNKLLPLKAKMFSDLSNEEMSD